MKRFASILALGAIFLVASLRPSTADELNDVFALTDSLSASKAGNAKMDPFYLNTSKMVNDLAADMVAAGYDSVGTMRVVQSVEAVLTELSHGGRITLTGLVDPETRTEWDRTVPTTMSAHFVNALRIRLGLEIHSTYRPRGENYGVYLQRVGLLPSYHSHSRPRLAVTASLMNR